MNTFLIERYFKNNYTILGSSRSALRDCSAANSDAGLRVLAAAGFELFSMNFKQI
jgi:hypothetical protein